MINNRLSNVSVNGSGGTIGEIWIILIGFHGILNSFSLIERLFHW
jgi:hypothetical protein